MQSIIVIVNCDYFSRLLLLVLSVLELTCTNNFHASCHMLLSNKVVPIVDLAHRYFSLPDSSHSSKAPLTLTEHLSSSLKYSDSSSSSFSHLRLDKILTNVCSGLFNVLAVVMSSVMTDKTIGDSELVTVKDCIRYWIMNACYRVHVVSCCFVILFLCTRLHGYMYT